MQDLKASNIYFGKANLVFLVLSTVDFYKSVLAVLSGACNLSFLLIFIIKVIVIREKNNSNRDVFLFLLNELIELVRRLVISRLKLNLKKKNISPKLKKMMLCKNDNFRFCLLGEADFLL